MRVFGFFCRGVYEPESLTHDNLGILVQQGAVGRRESAGFMSSGKDSGRGRLRGGELAVRQSRVAAAGVGEQYLASLPASVPVLKHHLFFANSNQSILKIWKFCSKIASHLLLLYVPNFLHLKYILVANFKKKKTCHILADISQIFLMYYSSIIMVSPSIILSIT